MSFNVLNTPTITGVPVEASGKGTPVEQVEKLIKGSDVFLFMKGTPEAPMCGFSANVAKILHDMGVGYQSFDVLSNQEIRQAAKDYASWPTYPQLYFKGDLLGGNDIVMEMFESGELKSLFSK